LKLLIYRLRGAAPESVEARPEARLLVWRPTIRSLKPDHKGWKYVFYSLFHWASVFRNRDYCSLSVNVKGEPKASMLVVPTHFRWPFMAQDDLQFTYVITSAAARRQGWASYLVREGIRQFAREGRSIWYVTDTNNLASQKLAEKSGFDLAGSAEPRNSRFHRVRLIANAESRAAR